MRRRRRIAHRLVRIVCGRRLPQTWNTVLVLLSIHMYLTVPVILAAGITEQMTGCRVPCKYSRAILHFRSEHITEVPKEKIKCGFRVPTRDPTLCKSCITTAWHIQELYKVEPIYCDSLLRPFRDLQKRGILLGEIDDDVLDIFYEQV
ncbi:unnamed protein product [Nippostrongylus brasiliensis]|uniref:Uncharacterized protein n=1 Tax=Nippostrongylus brasiliensis TaxID=27835 RepID=A0A0N4Y236_NIPBR|nr:unnamed protein product [Nippostrongylus brasiliensis]